MYHLTVTKSTNASNCRKIEVIENKDYENLMEIQSIIRTNYNIELTEDTNEYFLENPDESVQYYFRISYN